MDRTAARGVMAGIGGLAGLCFYALSEAWTSGALPARMMLFLSAGGLAFFAGLLVMAGPVGTRRAAVAALATAVPVAGLITWASLRYGERDLVGPSEAFAAVLLGTFPWPFWIAFFRGNWADYPTHFRESWSVVIRVAAGLVFTALVWGVIWLSDALLSLVGLDVIERLIRVDVVPFVVTGAVAGLAMAVVAELSDVLAPDLLLRLLRLLVPVVLGVMAVFLVALPLRGFGTVLGGLSVAGTLLAMAGVAVTLVAAACDCSEDRASGHPVMVRAGQGLAALVVVPAGLAVWALMLRVAEAGWTPPRVAGAAVAAVALGYGVGYLWAVAGGGRWRRRIRGVNLGMALAIVALAALWLTPLLDATAIAAQSQVARYADGRGTLDRLDLAALDRWGVAGAAGLAALEALGQQPGQQALAARLADRSRWTTGEGPPNPAAREALRRVLSVVPATAADAAAGLVEALEPWELRDWHEACERRLPDGRAACALVMADLWPEWPVGDPAAPEAVFLSLSSEGWLMQSALVRAADGNGWDRRGMRLDSGEDAEDGAAAIATLLDQGPVIEPVPAFRLRIGGRTVTIFP
ncbi:MAG: DUF4153 domain-containing protein [Gemmobacter sp.]